MRSCMLIVVVVMLVLATGCAELSAGNAGSSNANGDKQAWIEAVAECHHEEAINIALFESMDIYSIKRGARSRCASYEHSLINSYPAGKRANAYRMFNNAFDDSVSASSRTGLEVARRYYNSLSEFADCSMNTFIERSTDASFQDKDLLKSIISRSVAICYDEILDSRITPIKNKLSIGRKYTIIRMLSSSLFDFIEHELKKYSGGGAQKNAIATNEGELLQRLRDIWKASEDVMQ